MDHLVGAGADRAADAGLRPAARRPHRRRQLVYLRGPVPLRDTAAERRVVHKLRDKTEPAARPPRRPSRAPTPPASSRRLKRWRGDLSGDAAGIVDQSALAPELRLTEAAAARERPRRPVRPDVRSRSASTATKRAQRRAPSTPRRCCAAWHEGFGTGAARLAAAGPSLPQRLAAPSTASASPTCSPRARTTARSRPTRCPRWRRCAPSSSTRPRRASIAWRRWWPASTMLPEAALPADLTATLRRYQREGVRWLAFLRTAGSGRHPGRRHGPRQDTAGAGRARRGRPSSCARTSVRATTGAPRSRASGPG